MWTDVQRIHTQIQAFAFDVDCIQFFLRRPSLLGWMVPQSLGWLSTGPCASPPTRTVQQLRHGVTEVGRFIRPTVSKVCSAAGYPANFLSDYNAGRRQAGVPVAAFERRRGPDRLRHPEHASARSGQRRSPGCPAQGGSAQALARHHGRRVRLHMPARWLRAGLGGMADLSLAGQRIVPAQALAAGYHFEAPTTEMALTRLLGPAAAPGKTPELASERMA